MTAVVPSEGEATKAARASDPHPGLAGLAIGAMALAVAVGLRFVGVLEPVDDAVNRWIGSFGLLGGPQALSPWALWGWTLFVALAMPQAILHVPGRWRWWLLVVTTLALTLAWVPVLALGAHRVPLGVPVAAFLWAAAGSLIYAEKHRRAT